MQSVPYIITFDPSILTKSSGNVIDLQSAVPDLTGIIAIEGPGSNVLTVQRDASAAAFSVFTVDAGATAAISGLTISGGSATDGGGIDNLGSLTVSDSTLSGNSATDGGGISNDGTLSVNDSTLSGNTADSNGGGFANKGSLTVSDSTLTGNSASDGGGVYNDSSESATLSNVTLADNSASTAGGGIDVVSGSVLLHNSLIAGNLAGGNPSDVSGSLDSASDYNLISDGSGDLSTANHNQLGSSTNLLDPLLAPLGNYGGPTQTMAVLPGSPAIDAGSSTYGGSTDQRGKPRVGAPDIGAFESQGFTITVSSGNYPTTFVNTAFPDPLVVSVAANNAAEPVAGGVITFTAPVSGASAVLSGNPATIGSNGQASVTATANATAGTYTVSASATGVASPASFSLSNAPSNSQVTIDFDNLPGMSFWAGTPVSSWALLTDQYAGLGVIFQRAVVCDAGVGHAVTGTNFIAGITPSGNLTYSSHYPQIEFSFFVGQTPATTDFVSIRGDFEGGNGQSQTLDAYDLAGNLVGSSTEMDTGGQTQ